MICSPVSTSRLARCVRDSCLHPQDDYVAMIRDQEPREVNALTDRFDAFVDALSGYYARRLAEGV